MSQTTAQLISGTSAQSPTFGATTVTSLNGGPIAGTRNRIINGDMRIDQRNAGASLSVANTGLYSVDRWRISNSVSTVTVQQSSSVVPTDFSNSLGLTVSTTDSTGSHAVAHYVEGFNFSDLNWGSANAKTVTLSFWVRSSLVGTYGVGLQNSAQNRSYVATYTINAANTWEYKTITVAGDTTSTWIGSTNGIGLSLEFDLGSASSYNQAAGSWGTVSNARRTSGCVNWANTSSATFYITGVQLEPGTVATPFERRSFGAELALCQRYFAKTYDTGTVPGTVTSAGAISTNVNGAWVYAPSGTWCFPVAMRTQPTITLYSTANANTTGVSTADFTDGAATTFSQGASAVSIRRNNVSTGVSSGVDMKSQATASAEL
jgi:hypothetical protein